VWLIESPILCLMGRLGASLPHASFLLFSQGLRPSFPLGFL
jgi:hypothetical protein